MPPSPDSRPCHAQAHDLHRRFVNPAFVEMLDALGYGRTFVHAKGTKLRDDEGHEYTDFLSGFGVHNLGFNHPRVVARLREALGADAPSMLNIDAPLEQGLLARELCALTHPDLCRVAYANSGAEAVEIALKTARIRTGRTPLIACEGGYHGLSCGALSVMGSRSLRAPFEPLLGNAHWVPFGDLAALQQALVQYRPGAFIVEPVQGEGGVRECAPLFLVHAARACREHGCLLIVDEIQTGLGRTGRMFATPFDLVVPDILLLGKALSGGVVPVSAALMTSSLWDAAYGKPERSRLNASTFAGGHLAMIAALETLAVLRDEDLAAKAAGAGAFLLDRLRAMASRHSIVQEVRGRGLLVGIEFQDANAWYLKAVPAWVRESLYAHVVCALLLRDHRMVAQPCSLAGNVLRVEPALVVSEEEIDSFVDALDHVLDQCPSHTAAVAAAARKSLFKREL